MKIYDNENFEEVKNIEKEEYFSNLIKNQIEFITRMTNEKCDINSIKDRANKLDVVTFKEPQPKSYNVIQNGKIVSLRTPPTAAAFSNIRNVQNSENKKELNQAIYVSNSNSEHVVNHELFHALSTNTEILYNESGKGYIKKGVKILGYDKDENLIDTTLNADALNEGTTEMLAMKFDNSRFPQSYDVYVYIADILNVDTDNSLLNAYFSNDIEVFKNFLKEFDERQKIINSEELATMSSKVHLPFDKILQLTNASIEYTMSFCKTLEEYNVQKNRLFDICEYMKENSAVTGNEEETKTFLDNINKTFEKIEINIKENGDKTPVDILSDAINETTENIKMSDINEVGLELEKYINEQDKEYNLE